jgi:hypothetical protein
MTAGPKKLPPLLKLVQVKKLLEDKLFHGEYHCK